MKEYILIIALILNVVFIGRMIWRYVNRPPQPDKNAVYYFGNRDKVLKALPSDASDILFIGDSHFQLFELYEYFKNPKIKNRGICGDYALAFFHRIPDMAVGKPAKVFIEIGANDILENAKPEDVNEHIEKSIQHFHFHSPNTKIYLLSILPMNHGNNREIIKAEALRLKLNNIYKTTASDNGIVFIDLDPYFLESGLKAEYDSGDHVHLNGNGYTKWRDVLQPYIDH